MSQSLAKVYPHVIFSTKNRAPVLEDEWRDELFHVLGGTANSLGCQSLIVGGVADHVHLLFQLGRTIAIADAVGKYDPFDPRPSAWASRIALSGRKSAAELARIKPVSGPTSHKVLKLNALRPEGLNLAASKYVKVSDNIAKRFHLCTGDLLICRSVGSFEHIAKSALVEADEPGILFPEIIIRAKLNGRILPESHGSSSKPSLLEPISNRTHVPPWACGRSEQQILQTFPCLFPHFPCSNR